VFRIGVAKGLEAVAFIYGQGDPPGGFHAPGFKKGLGLVEGGLVHDHKVAVGLQVYLVDAHLAGNLLPCSGQPCGITHFLSLIRAGIDRHPEMLIMTGGNLKGGQTRQQHHDQSDSWLHTIKL